MPTLDQRLEQLEGFGLIFVERIALGESTPADHLAKVIECDQMVAPEMIERLQPSLILVSPGPGRPHDFGVPDLVLAAVRRGLPIFGVCLGLQGIVEAFGGELGVLGYPVHGKPSRIRHRNTGVFAGLPDEFSVGRYHSLYALPERLPEVLEVTAESEDGVIMGVRHRALPIEAVQFHPESILSSTGEVGLALMRNAMRLLPRKKLAEINQAGCSKQPA